MSTDKEVLDGLLPDEPVKALLDCTQIALKITALLIRYDAREYWMRMIEEAASAIEKQYRASDDWKEKRDAYFRQVWNQQCRKLADVPSEKFQEALDRLIHDAYKQYPAKGWAWELEDICIPEDGTRRSVWGWVPHELARENDPFLGPTLPLNRPLDLPFYYTVLAAIHDATLIGVQPIDPWTPNGKTSPSDNTPVYYVILCQKVKELLASHSTSIEAFLLIVEADLKKLGTKDIGPGREKHGVTESGTQMVEDSLKAEPPEGKTLQDLEPAVRKAYLSFSFAETKMERRLEDKEAWDFLRENGIEGKGDLGELTDYNLPVFDTWSRQLRNARKHLNEQKYRRGRHVRSRSIVTSPKIEHQQ